MNTPEIPPPPRTPPMVVRGPHGILASIPSAIVVALITTFGARFLAPASEEMTRLREDVKELRKEMSELKYANAALLARLNDLDDDKKNARLIEALKAGRSP